VLKCGEGLKTGVVISLSMIMSYLSGLMSAQVKYQAVKSLPILAYINPGNLIADAFYSLYYYNTYERYFLNVILLFAFSVVFYLVVYFVMRRQQYESI
jgi:ABC-2 type transport system permease protein